MLQSIHVSFPRTTRSTYMYRRTITLLLAVLLAAISITPIGAMAAEQQPRQSASSPYFVDTDMGVDDAVAVAWLLQNRAAKIVGFSTVTGNNSVDNATQNLLTLLDAAGRHNIPVTMGATGPLVYRASHTGAFVHGPTGFWF